MTDGDVIRLGPNQSRKTRRKADGWQSQCTRTTSGQMVPNLANAMLFLRHDTQLAGCFAYDEMDEAAILLTALPGGVPVDVRHLTDNDLGIVQEYLQRQGLSRLGRDVVHQAVDMRARELPFHPVRQYLTSLEWDQKPRLIHWLETYLGAETSPYVEAIGCMFLTAMCARVFEPGCKMDYMLVLEGAQGGGKSAACRILGGEYYSDAMPDISCGKDASQHLRGKWLIELAELSALGRAEAAALKAFLTREVERYRPPYARLEVVQPRQCCFIGTTNKTAYLRDETGARRFWPVKMGKIAVDALAVDRDQLFAEAMRLYQHGIPWWPDQKFERTHILREQELRFEADIWEESISQYLMNKDKVLVGEVAREAVQIATPRIGRTEQLRIAAILERLGWERQPKDSRGNISWKRRPGYG